MGWLVSKLEVAFSVPVMAEPRHSHVFITLPAQSPTFSVPPFLLTQLVKTLPEVDIMKLKV